MGPEPELKAVVYNPSPMGIFEQSLALQERGWLGAMALDFYFDLERSPWKWLPEGRVRSYLKKRNHPAIEGRRVLTHPWSELYKRAKYRFDRRDRALDRGVFAVNAAFDRWMASRVVSLGNLAFGYESASLFTFRRAREAGIPTVLYQPIACAESAARLLDEEKELVPDAADTLRYCWFPEEEIERRREERRLADAIICASQFTKQSLIETGVPAEKIFVEAYGVNQDTFYPSRDKFSKFSIIWASSFTQTKGITYLLDALAKEPVPGAELVLAGYPFGSDPVTRYEGRVRIRRLGHVNRDELSREMRRCHAHVFPTLLDGFGRNIIEAMASGLPVITTPNCAGPDLIEDGVTGFVVPIRDVEMICDRLSWIHDHPIEAMEMGERARDRVAGLTQPDYRRRFAGRIHSIWKSERNGPSGGSATPVGALVRNWSDGSGSGGER